MASTSETGHVKNISNFQKLISFCNGYNAKYNPSREELKIASLQVKVDAAKAAVEDAKSKEIILGNATSKRKDAFTGIKSYSTKIVNALGVSGVSDNIVKNAKTINKKMQGQRGSAVEEKESTITPKDNVTEVNTVTASTEVVKSKASVSQQSFDKLVEHLTGLSELVSSQPEYIPNETELQANTIKAYIEQLTKANNSVIEANTDFSNSRISRDSLLYGEKSGLVDIALDVKNYVKSVFGATSPQYAQVKGLSFKRA